MCGSTERVPSSQTLDSITTRLHGNASASIQTLPDHPVLVLTCCISCQSSTDTPQTVESPQTKAQDSTTPNPPQASDPDKQPGFRRFFHDEYRIWTSPFRAGNYDSHTMKKYGAPFFLISGALIATRTFLGVLCTAPRANTHFHIRRPRD